MSGMTISHVIFVGDCQPIQIILIADYYGGDGEAPGLWFLAVQCILYPGGEGQSL